jgi:signal transduction histidine kinase
LTNVDKHAKATRVDVLLDYTREHSVLLKVEDYGVGTDKVRTGFGLSGIRERVQLLRGEVEIETAVGRGFCLEVKLPT